MTNKLNEEQLLNKLIDRCENSLYTFDINEIVSKYKNQKTKIPIYCKKHGKFLISFDSFFYAKNDCQECAGHGKHLLNVDKLIEKLEQRCQNTFYSFDKEYFINNYKNCDSKMNFICSIHGAFSLPTYTFLNGANCQKCLKVFPLSKDLSNLFEMLEERCSLEENLFFIKEEIIETCKNSNSKILLHCKLHGEFYICYTSFFHQRSGCQKCKAPKGEKMIYKILKQFSVFFEVQKTFDDCKYKQPLKFDFYLPFYNICIEFHGEQHYTFNNHFYKNENEFEKRKMLDEIKRNYCTQQNILLLEIKHDHYKKEKDLIIYLKSILEKGTL